MSGIHVKFEITPDEFLAHLSEAAYHVALKHGFEAPFDEVELDLVKALREVIRQDMQASHACGETPGCLEASRCEPWSQEAGKLFKD